MTCVHYGLPPVRLANFCLQSVFRPEKLRDSRLTSEVISNHIVRPVSCGDHSSSIIHLKRLSPSNYTLAHFRWSIRTDYRQSGSQHIGNNLYQP